MARDRTRGWMGPTEAAYYCKTGVNAINAMIRAGVIPSVPSVAARLSGDRARMQRERVVSAAALDEWMSTDY